MQRSSANWSICLKTSVVSAAFKAVRTCTPWEVLTKSSTCDGVVRCKRAVNGRPGVLATWTQDPVRDESFITSWGRGAVTFSCDVQFFSDPPPQSHWKKNLDPPLDLWQKSLWPPPPPNSQYSSPQTQSFIFAINMININIATTYLKIVCLLWIAMFFFLRVISCAWWQR